MHLVWTLTQKANLGGVLHSSNRRWRSTRSRLTGQAGQTLAEYAMLVAGIAVVVVLLALLTFRGSITSAFDSASNCLQTACSQTSDEEDAGNNDHCTDGNGQDGNQGNCDD